MVFFWIAALVLGSITLLSLCNQLLPHDFDAPHIGTKNRKESIREMASRKAMEILFSYTIHTQTSNKLHYSFGFGFNVQ